MYYYRLTASPVTFSRISTLFGIIKAESISSSDIANSLSDEKKWAKLDSIKKRIYRF